MNTVRMCDMPQVERPRERLAKAGPSVLSSQELLAIILRVGSEGDSAISLANRVLARFGSLDNLAQATVPELCEIRGIGIAKAVQVLAAIELGRRAVSGPDLPGDAVQSPADVSRYMGPRLGHQDREHFCALMLNTRGVVVSETTVSIGSLNASLVHPRELFRDAVRHSAASMILVHNHPSGDVTPSREDIQLTRRLMKCGSLMGIEIVDHVIIGKGHKFLSMKEQGLI
jgi:DNA repair protein RadC